MTQQRKHRSRLAESAYLSPFSRAGAPDPHPNTDPYAPLRTQALQTLIAMGFDPETMVEHSVIWAEHQDPFGHVTQSQVMAFFGACFWRVGESYAEWLDDDEYEGMIQGKTTVPVVRKYALDIRRQVKYPDSLIAAFRQDKIEPTRNNGTTCLFSLKQQAIVAEVKGSTTYMDVKTATPVDIRTLGPGWVRVFEGLTKKTEETQKLKEKWEHEHPKRTRSSSFGSSKL